VGAIDANRAKLEIPAAGEDLFVGGPHSTFCSSMKNSARKLARRTLRLLNESKSGPTIFNLSFPMESAVPIN
jgi:hypothetical protein